MGRVEEYFDELRACILDEADYLEEEIKELAKQRRWANSRSRPKNIGDSVLEYFGGHSNLRKMYFLWERQNGATFSAIAYADGTVSRERPHQLSAQMERMMRHPSRNWAKRYAAFRNNVHGPTLGEGLPYLKPKVVAYHKRRDKEREQRNRIEEKVLRSIYDTNSYISLKFYEKHAEAIRYWRGSVADEAEEEEGQGQEPIRTPDR